MKMIKLICKICNKSFETEHYKKQTRKYCSQECSKKKIPWNKNKINIYSDETLEKMRTIKEGCIPWNKGLECPQLSSENNSFYGKHHTNENKDKIRKSRINITPWNKNIKCPQLCGNNNGMYHKPPPHGAGRGNGQHYDSPLQGKIWLRSSYELAYAKYLDENKILWMYEMETFDLGDTTYTPDFFLVKEEKFIEIKGYMRKEAQEKINKFLEQYPWDLEILRKKDLIKLGCEL